MEILYSLNLAANLERDLLYRTKSDKDPVINSFFLLVWCMSRSQYQLGNESTSDTGLGDGATPFGLLDHRSGTCVQANANGYLFTLCQVTTTVMCFFFLLFFLTTTEIVTYPTQPPKTTVNVLSFLFTYTFKRDLHQMLSSHY